MSGFDREFGEGFGGLDLIEFLEITAARVALVGGARDHDGRPGVDGAVGEASEAVDAPRPGDCEEHAGPGSEVAIGGGSVTGRLLVVESDETDSEGDGAVGE